MEEKNACATEWRGMKEISGMGRPTDEDINGMGTTNG
jgi:hypothetical protein